MEQESYPLKSCPHPRRLVQVNIGLWVSFQFFSRLAAVFAEEIGDFGVLRYNGQTCGYMVKNHPP